MTPEELDELGTELATYELTVHCSPTRLIVRDAQDSTHVQLARQQANRWELLYHGHSIILSWEPQAWACLLAGIHTGACWAD